MLLLTFYILQLHNVFQYFPGTAPVRRYLKRVNDWLQAQRAPLSGAEWLHNVEDMQVRYFINLITFHNLVDCWYNDMFMVQNS